MSIHTNLDSSLITLKAQTRAERRRLEKQQAKSNKTYNMTAEQLRSYREECRREFIEEERNAIDNIVFNSFVIALNKIEGFGKVRINRVLEEAREQVECLKLGYLSVEDMKRLSESLQGKADKIR